MTPLKRTIHPPVLLGLALLGLFLAGCAPATPDTKIGRAAEAMFGKTGLLKEAQVEKFIAMDADNAEKIDVLMGIVREGELMKRASAVSVIARIDHPHRVDVLIELLKENTDTSRNVVQDHESPAAVKQQIAQWAVTGLGLSFEPRAYEALFDVLNTSDNNLLVCAILHDLGFAPINAKETGKELPDELRRRIEEQVRAKLVHDDRKVSEHAERALLRLQGKLGDFY